MPLWTTGLLSFGAEEKWKIWRIMARNERQLSTTNRSMPMTPTTRPSSATSLWKNIATSAARSHAMRMHWRRRASARENWERGSKNYLPTLRPLLPNNTSRYRNESIARRTSDENTLPKEKVSPSASNGSASFSEQIWAGIEFRFDLVLKQKTECFSFRISAEHRRIFYHCEQLYRITEKVILKNLTQESMFL